MVDEITWALCSWFEENGAHLIHPDDLDRMRSFKPYGVVFTVLSNGQGYTEICAGFEKFRVLPEALRIIKPEKSWVFEIGESVSVVGQDYIGTIAGISWHQKEQKPMYSLKVAGKLKSKRYWSDDLEKLQVN